MLKTQKKLTEFRRKNHQQQEQQQRIYSLRNYTTYLFINKKKKLTENKED